MKDIILYNVRGIKNTINLANKIFDESYWRKDYYTQRSVIVDFVTIFRAT